VGVLAVAVPGFKARSDMDSDVPTIPEAILEVLVMVSD
jgi:hypothetical protein